MSKIFISRLRLVNYKRMSPIKEFIFEPDGHHVLQMVLGTNGSGKSSLMNELWPLPGVESDFGVNGRKEFDAHYNGKFYQLVSSFEGKPQHEFKVDGIDLNDGGKIEMFRALCMEHFHVNDEIRSLALEEIRLSDMLPAKRRYWMVKLADTDFTYAMGVYKKLQEAHRDAQGAIKRLQKRLVDERVKLADKSVIEVLSTETHEIKNLINEIYGMRNAEAAKADDVLRVLEGNCEDLNRYSNEADRLNIDLLVASGYNNREEMIERRDQVKLEIHGVQQVKQHLFTNHEKIQKKYQILVKAGTESVSELEFKKRLADETIAYEKAYIVMPTVVIDQDPIQMAAVMKDIFHDLYDKISTLPGNDGQYSSSKADETESQLSALRSRKNALQGRIARLGADIEHKRDHVQQDLLNCPKCHHTWSAKASEDDLRRAEVALKELKEEFENLSGQEELLAKYLKEYGEYAEAYRAVTMLMRTAPILRNYFAEITQNSRLVRYPSSVAGDLSIVQTDLEHHVEIKKQTDISRHASEQIELKRNLDADTLENIEREMSDLEESMGIQTRKLSELNDELKNVENLIRQDHQISLLHSQMLTAYDVQEKELSGYVYSRFQELLWTLIMTLQTQLARKEDALAQINSQQQIVDEIQSQLDEAIMNERVAKMAHVALSPTNGAIAEGLQRSISNFTEKMNRIIAHIWSYPLELQAIQMEDGTADMDYKFPFKKNREEKPHKDVSEGSKSMIAIFNFAFRVCALNKLGHFHLPLFLDEFESAFDDIHRERAIYFVKRMIEENTHGQIFMVSHFEANHGALSNLAQTCVLSKDNLLLPSDMLYNEHVTIS